MQVHFIKRNHSLWPAAVAHIKKIYQETYDAQVIDFPAELVVITNHLNEVVCTAGIRTTENSFFSDRYLDIPLAQAVSAASGHSVAVDQIIETVSLSSSLPFTVMPLMDAIAIEGRKRQMKWSVFTATRPLRSILKRLGVPLLKIASATADRMDDPLAWGTYYQTDPWVCAFTEDNQNQTRFSPRLFSASQSPQTFRKAS